MKKPYLIELEEIKAYYFRNRNTAVMARSLEEARAKKKRGGDELVAVRTPNETEKRQMAKGIWVRTRRDGKSPEKSRYGKGRGYGPPRELSAREELMGIIEFGVRAVREIAAGRLSPSAISRLQGIWKGERLIKRVGSGNTQNADLVLHPKHGLSIRKSARDGIVNQDYVAEGAKHVQQAQRELGSSSGFAKVYEIGNNGVSYHEYVPGRTLAAGKMYKTWPFLKKELEEVNHKRFIPTARSRYRHAKWMNKEFPNGYLGQPPSDSYIQDQILRGIKSKIFNRNVRRTPEQQNLIRHLEKKGAHVTDIVPRNVIGNKIVDVDVKGVGNQQALQIGSTSEYPAYRAFKDRKWAEPEIATMQSTSRRKKAPERSIVPYVAGAGAVGIGAGAYLATRKKKEEQLSTRDELQGIIEFSRYIPETLPKWAKRAHNEQFKKTLPKKGEEYLTPEEAAEEFRKIKEKLKKLSAREELQDIIEFGLFGDSKKLIKKLRGGGVEITKGRTRNKLPSGYFPDKYIANPPHEEFRQIAPRTRFINISKGGHKELGISPLQILWHEAGHARRKASQIDPNSPRYKTIRVLAVERGANRAAMKLADEIGVSPKSRETIKQGLKRSYRSYKNHAFNRAYWSKDNMKKHALNPFYTETIQEKKKRLQTMPYLKGYGFSAREELQSIIEFSLYD
jgi:hypothetical protein